MRLNEFMKKRRETMLKNAALPQRKRSQEEAYAQYDRLMKSAGEEDDEKTAINDQHADPQSDNSPRHDL